MPPHEPVAVTTMAVALSVLHAALPNHWLPFVLVGRALRWSRARTLLVLALAGGGHVVVTSALGLLVWWLGDALVQRFEGLETWAGRIAGSLLLLLGLVYLALHASGRHAHSHAGADAIYADEHDAPRHVHETREEHSAHAGRARAAAVTERGAVATLFLALMLSPCEALIPIFLAGVTLGFQYVLFMAVAVSLATVAAMFLLTWLTLIGVERLEAPWLDRYEMLLTGGILGAIGLTLIVLRP